MKTIFAIFPLIGIAGTCLGQGFVYWAGISPFWITAHTNTQQYSPLFGGGPTGGGTIGYTAPASSGLVYYYELLYNTNFTGSQVPTPDAAALLGTWLDTGLTATNAPAPGQLVPVNPNMAAVVPWDNGTTNNIMLVGWSANLGTSWAVVSNKLANWDDYSSSVTGEAFFGESVTGYLTPGSSAFFGAQVFGMGPTAVGLPIYSPYMQLYWLPPPDNAGPFILSQPTNQNIRFASAVNFSVVAVGTLPLAYQWFLGNHRISQATNATLQLTNVQAAQAGAYCVVVTNLYGAVTSAPAMLVLYPAPDPTNCATPIAISSGFNSDVIADGSGPPSASTTACIDGSGGYVFFDSSYAAGHGTSGGAFVSGSVTGSDGNQFFLMNPTVNNALLLGGYLGTSSGTLFFNAPVSVGALKILATAGYGPTILDYTVNFQGGGTASGTLTVADWEFPAPGGSATVGGMGRVYRATGQYNSYARPNNLYTYSISVSSSTPVASVSFAIDPISWNSVATAVVFAISQIPNIFLAALPQGVTVEAGAGIDLPVRASGEPPFTYQWFFNGHAITDCTTNQVFRLSGVQATNVGTYTVVVSNCFGTVTSGPVKLNVIPQVGRRAVPALNLVGQTGSPFNLEYADALGSPTNWLPLDTVDLTAAPQLYLDVSAPLPPERFYRVWQMGTPALPPSLNLPFLVPALTLTGNIGDQLRLDCINQFGPTDAWVTLDTVTLTNTSQLYFDLSAPGQPPRLWRIVPVP